MRSVPPPIAVDRKPAAHRWNCGSHNWISEDGGTGPSSATYLSRLRYFPPTRSLLSDCIRLDVYLLVKGQEVDPAECRPLSRTEPGEQRACSAVSVQCIGTVFFRRITLLALTFQIMLRHSRSIS